MAEHHPTAGSGAEELRYEIRDQMGLVVARLHYVTDVLEFVRNAHSGGRGPHEVWVDGEQMEGQADPDCMAQVLLRFKFSREASNV